MRGKYTGSNELKILREFVIKELPDNISLTTNIKRKCTRLIIELETKNPDLIHTWEVRTRLKNLTNSQYQIIDEVKIIFSKELDRIYNDLLEQNYQKPF